MGKGSDRLIGFALGVILLLLLVNAVLAYGNVQRLGGDTRRVVRTDQVLAGTLAIMGSALVLRDVTDRRRAEADLAERVRLAQYGCDIGKALTRSSTLPEMLQLCAEATVGHLDAAFARIWTLDDGADVLELRASAGIYTHLDGPHGRVPVGRSEIGRIARERRPHLTNSVLGDERVHDRAWAGREGLVAFAGYPLIVDDHLVGVLAMFARHPLSRAALEKMASVADDIALGIRRKRSEERLHRQREWLRVTLSGVGDGVIATDVEGRVSFLNPMAEALTGWSLRDASGMPLERVFRIVNEATREPVENPVVRALAEGTVVGLVNPTILIARDGVGRAIDDGAAPIRDEAGAVMGAVLIFRDVEEQRRARRELESSEARTAAIVETALDAIITIDHRGHILEWNPAAERIFGFPGAEAIGREMATLIIPPALREAHHEGMDRYLSSGVGAVLGRRVEITAARADGSEFPAELSVTRIPTGGPPVFTAHVRDISERKRDEAERTRLVSIIEHSPDFIGLADAEQRVLFVNRAGRDLAGLGGEAEVRQTRILDLFPEGERRRIVRDVMPVLMDTGHWDGEVAFQDLQTGATTPVMWNVFTLRDPEDGRPYFACVSRDLTERKEVEETLRESGRRFRELADSMPQIIWTARPDGQIDYFNRRWYEFTGRREGERDDLSWRPILHPDDVRRCHDRWSEAVRTGEPYEIEYRFWDRGRGEYRWFLGRALAARDAAGRIVKWYGSSTDIDDQKRAESALREAHRRKNEFLATLAHELRNPLAPIRNALHIMRLTGGEGEACGALREMMERQVHNMSRLVEDLLDVSRIESGRIELRRQAVDLVTVARQAVEATRPFIEKRRHELTVSLPDEPIPLEADSTRLEQVIDNLLNNAAKYTDPGGRIWLEVIRDGDAAVVRLRDTGIGIDPAMVPKVFDLFVQIERRTDRSQGGLGIGLSLVKSLVEMHGGSVMAHSEGPGRGSEFVVRLPLAGASREPARAEAGPPSSTPGAKPGRRRILVVDDNQDAADSLSRLLTRLYGQDVRVAYDGPSALELAEPYRPEVILLDIGLPGIDGYEVARRLRARPEFRDSMLVAVTGWGQEQDRRRSQEAGFDHHLVKPVEPEAVRQLLAGSGPAHSS